MSNGTPPIELLRVSNFKSLEDVRIKFGRITVLVGPNGSGKSSVIQALGILKQSLGEESLKLSGGFFDLGDFSDLVFRHDESRTLQFNISGTKHFAPELLPSGQSASYSYKVAVDKKGLASVTGNIRTGLFDISTEWKRGVRSQTTTQKQATIGRYQFGFGVNGPPRIGHPIDVTQASNPTGDELEFDAVREQVERLLDTIRDVLSQTYFVPAGRGVDKREYPLGEESTFDFVSAAGITAQAEQFAGALAYTRGLAARVTRLMLRVTGVRLSILMEPRRNVAVVTESGEGKDELVVNIVNEGMGTNQLVLLLTQLVSSPQDSVVTIEEPEVHLHPRAQAALAEVLVDYATQENKHLLLATHSEHVLFGLLTAVAQGKLRPEEVRVYYMTRKKHSATAEEVQVDSKGRLEKGFAGFFEADVQEFDKYLSALTRQSNT